MQPVSTRQPYLDWLRILSILCVFMLHSGMAFVPWEWHIKDKETSQLLMEFNFVLSRLRMPLLFFISGTVTWFMLQHRTSKSFIGLRLRRLLIPLVFGMLVIVPPQVYMERLTQGFKGNFLDFYPSIFTTGAYPKGNLSWHHLWFIVYLFVYDVVFARIFKWVMSESGKKSLSFFNNLAKGKRIYLLVLPGTILFTSMTLSFPETHDLIHDWCRLFYWLFFLLTGFICINFSSLMDSLENNRRTSLLFAFITILAINYLRWNDIEPDHILPHWQSDWRTYAYFSLYPLSSWACIFTAIGYGKHYLNRKHAVLNYLNEAIYPIYILHQTVIVIIVFYVIRAHDAVLGKFVFTFCTALLVTICIYHLFIRPFAVTRYLFGMKPKGKATKYKLQETSDTVEHVNRRKEKSIEIIEPAFQIS
jgi:hypothetical protein